MRLAGVGCMLLAVALFGDRSALVPGWKDLCKYVCAGLFGVVFVFYLSNIAFVTIPVGLTVILFYTNPFWTVMGATFLGYERFTLRRALALAAGFAWVLLGERLAFHQIAGGLFIASAVLSLILEKSGPDTAVREGA
ncbi:MAG: EamA family transporter [Synergistota bacterium]|nr:EamA family transporter [Synergistota bacterium]